MDSNLPLPIGDSATDPPFKPDIGRVYEKDGRLYRLVKASASIAASSNGKQLATVVSAGAPTWAVDLNTTSGNQYVCGALPSAHSAAIAASAYFLALVRGVDDLAATATGASSITTGSILVPGTASDLVRVTTGVTAADIDDRVRAYCGFALEAWTGTAITNQGVAYRAPFLG